MTAPMSRAEILLLPPTHDLPTLGRALGLSEPSVRERARSGELDAIGIKVVRLGAQYRVVTAFLGIALDSETDGASNEANPPVAARQRRAAASALRSMTSHDGG